MAKYTQSFKDKVKDDFLKGRYKTFSDLARAHKITNTKLIYRWKKEEGWDEEYKAEVEREKSVASRAEHEKDLDEFKEISAVHSSLWRAIIAQIATRFKKREDGSVNQLNAAELEALARILLRAQEGHRAALGVNDLLGMEQNITINYPGLDKIAKMGQLYDAEENRIVDQLLPTEELPEPVTPLQGQDVAEEPEEAAEN